MAIAGDDGIEIALARSLADNMSEDADWRWQKSLGDADKGCNRRIPPERGRPCYLITSHFGTAV